MNAQTAFAKGVTLTPCKGATPLSSRVTWIGTNPHFGLATIDAQCPEDFSFNIIFMIEQDPHGFWSPETIAGTRTNATLSRQNSYPFPKWLDIPPHNYVGIYSTGEGEPHILLRGWADSHQFYLGGTVGREIAPAQSGTLLTLGAYQGSIVQDQGLTLVLVPLEPDKTFLFVSTAAPEDTKRLALELLDHIGELASL